jgi:hypothetical protein
MRLLALVFVSVLNLLAAAPLLAQDDGGFGRMGALPANALDDGAPITLTPDGPAVIQLDSDAASVIVGNPAQATAILENPRLIMLVPQQPGATKIIALDRNGKTLLNRRVLVGGNRDGFIRVNKVCNQASGANCRPVSMYYCPGRCYETSIAQPGAEISEPTNPPAPENSPAPALTPPDVSNGDTGVSAESAGDESTGQ